MNKKKVLIINDVTGYGRVSSFAMFPVMAQYGLHPYLLPTAIVSNTMDYGSSEILDTTDFMRSTVLKWEDFGFSFHTVATGLINSTEQVDIICKLIESQDSPYVMVDPIMADSGELYPGMYEGANECNRRLASLADLIVPNFTEACMLAESYCDRIALSDEEYQDLAEKLLNLGPAAIVISGCTDAEGKSFNLICEADGKPKKLYYDRIPQQFIGTGDVFSACILSEIMTGADLEHSVESAARFVRTVITDNLNNNDHFDLII